MSSPSLKQIAPWTRRIIWVNVIIFVIGQLFLATGGDNPISEHLALRVNQLMEGSLWQLFTYMWIHADFLIIHIIFNMMTLYFLGRVVEFRLGRRSFLWLYVLGGVASVGLFLLDVGIQALVLGQAVNFSQPLVGASGAVCAVLGVFSLMVPDAKLYLMFLPWPVRAVKAVRGLAWFSVIAMILGWIPAISDSSSLGWLFSIAHSAHLGGILFGWWFVSQIKSDAESAYV